MSLVDSSWFEWSFLTFKCWSYGRQFRGILGMLLAPGLGFGHPCIKTDGASAGLPPPKSLQKCLIQHICKYFLTGARDLCQIRVPLALHRSYAQCSTSCQVIQFTSEKKIWWKFHWYLSYQNPRFAYTCILTISSDGWGAVFVLF